MEVKFSFGDKITQVLIKNTTKTQKIDYARTKADIKQLIIKELQELKESRCAVLGAYVDAINDMIDRVCK